MKSLNVCTFLAAAVVFSAFGLRAGDAAVPKAETAGAGRTIRLLTIGNSFAGNSCSYIQQIAAAAGNRVVLGQANPGGCPLERHWGMAQRHEKNPKDEGSLYSSGKGLRELLQSGTWDFVTLQQYSLISHEIKTYRPFAANLRDYVKQWAPQAEVLFLQTWAYRADDPRFTGQAKAGEPATQQAMHEQLTKAYETIAGELGVRLIPAGDAFSLVDNDPAWGYKPVPGFDPAKAVPPTLPEQRHSLYVGYTWKTPKEGGAPRLNLDAHHASSAGCYLAGCVLYETIFGQNCVGNTFRPTGMSAEDVLYLQEAAHRVGAARAAAPKR